MKENTNFVKGSRKPNNYKYYPVGIGGVYFIKHDLTGHFYIGSSNDVNRRFSHHFGKLKRGVHACPQFQDFYDKHDYKDFSYSVEEIVNDDERKRREVGYLNLYANNPLILNSSTVNNSWVSNKNNEQQVVEWKKKLSDKGKQRIGDKSSFYGKKHSEESKKKISENRSGKGGEFSQKSIVINGVFYKSLIEAHLSIDVSIPTICHRLKNANKIFCNWYYFEDLKEVKVIDERLLFDPYQCPNGLYDIHGETFLDSKEICQKYNLKRNTLYNRLKSANFPEWKRLI